MKTLLMTVSMITVLAAAPALAQDPAQRQAPAAGEQPAATSPHPAVKPSTAGDAYKPGDSSVRTAPGTQAATSGSWHASKLIGATVKGAGNEPVGDINDLILAKDGAVTDVIVGVGGFLGIGEKNVALKFSELSFARGENNSVLVTSKATKQSLEAAGEWKSSENTFVR
ncbi:MAG: PRC-barrel domain-containing protein [Hyphomicrobiaceae bacterium]|nr:PRC-barrel domain-containing protein [Hyphomicrobiaceae bacterium]